MPIKNKRMKYDDETGYEFDADYVMDIANALSSLQYGVPLFATEVVEQVIEDAEEASDANPRQSVSLATRPVSGP